MKLKILVLHIVCIILEGAVFAVFFPLAAPLVAQEASVAPEGTQVATQETPAAATNADELRKQVQNPVASLISVPLQNNMNLGVGPDGRIQNVLNIQPVIPVRLSDDWNLIIRFIAPIVYQPTVSHPFDQGASGLGDMNPTFFLSPAKPHKIIWGVGPAFVFPTATNFVLGQGKWSIGPSVVVLTQPGHWTIGALVNNVWSFAGQSRRPDVNQMLLQYFINYNLKKGWYIAVQPIITANWEVTNGNVWTVPFGGGIGRIMKLGYQPVNLQVQAYRNAFYPAGTSTWSMRMQIAFLFPKLTKEEEKMLMEQKLKQLENEQQQTPPK
jgi:hypothetical protein